mmetsp:Transcript_10235/g.22130  ORF Transcript_10235/g.22130 Transcript_10235/m.22130 type:complete len:254 (-) Transcript_10235:115-876(-)
MAIAIDCCPATRSKQRLFARRLWCVTPRRKNGTASAIGWCRGCCFLVDDERCCCRRLRWKLRLLVLLISSLRRSACSDARFAVSAAVSNAAADAAFLGAASTTIHQPSSGEDRHPEDPTANAIAIGRAIGWHFRCGLPATDASPGDPYDRYSFALGCRSSPHRYPYCHCHFCSSLVVGRDAVAECCCRRRSSFDRRDGVVCDRRWNNSFVPSFSNNFNNFSARELTVFSRLLDYAYWMRRLMFILATVRSLCT